MTTGSTKSVQHTIREVRPQAASERRELTSTELFAGRREVRIHHAGEIYFLRLTGKGKLILTK